MNTSMFLPQVPEDDIYDANGNQVDDINSVVEYVMVTLGLDHHADDEDDDSGQNFHLVKMVEFCQPVFNEIKATDFFITEPAAFGEYKENKIPVISFDILIPPPKLNA